jgi:hypothetical protein
VADTQANLRKFGQQCNEPASGETINVPSKSTGERLSDVINSAYFLGLMRTSNKSENQNAPGRQLHERTKRNKSVEVPEKQRNIIVSGQQQATSDDRHFHDRHWLVESTNWRLRETKQEAA